MIIGAPRNDMRGAAYVYERTPMGWVEVDELEPSQPSSTSPPQDQFGNAVAIEGDLAVVASRAHNTGRGIIYIYERMSSGWQEVHFVVEPLINAAFGAAVAIDGGRVFVGRPFPYQASGAPRAVLVYEEVGGAWTKTAEILPSQNSFQFGMALAVDSNRLIVGAPEPPGSPGSAYIFHATVNGWSEEQRLTPSDGEPYDLFGAEVAISGDLALVGSPWANDYRGHAYAFVRDLPSGTWSESAILVANDSAEGDAFGSAILLQGTSALISATGDDDFAQSSGSVYEFDGSGSTWVQVQETYSANPAQEDYFGTAIDRSGATLVIGAAGLGNGASGGNYALVQSNVIGVPYCTVNPNSTGEPAVIGAFGSCDAGSNGLSLGATQLPPNRFGYFLLSETQAFFPLPGGSQGNLCIGGTIGRFQALVQNSGPAGEIAITVDLTNVPLFGAITAGETWNFTCWYRDVGGNSNFTGGITIPFN